MDKNSGLGRKGELESRAKTRDCVILFWIHLKSFLYNYTPKLLSYISIPLKICLVDFPANDRDLLLTHFTSKFSNTGFLPIIKYDPQYWGSQDVY